MPYLRLVTHLYTVISGKLLEIHSLSQPNFISFRHPYQANVIAAEGEKKASHALKEASDVISGTIHKRRRHFFSNFLTPPPA